MKTFLDKTPRETIKVTYKDIVNTLKKFWIETPNSILFWNIMFYIAFFITLIFSIEIAAIISSVGSLFILAIIIDGDNKIHHWYMVTIIFWFTIFIVCFFGIMYVVYYYTIKRFNTWLDNLKNKHEN